MDREESCGGLRRKLVAGNQRQTQHADKIKDALFIFGVTVGRLISGNPDDVSALHLLGHTEQF